MTRFQFELRRAKKGKSVRKFAVGGLVVNPEYLRSHELLGAPYSPPLVIVVPDFGRAVFGSVLRRGLRESVRITTRPLPIKIGGSTRSHSVDSASIAYAIFDDNHRRTEFLSGDVYFCDEVIERLRSHFAADDIPHHLNLANHVCGIIDWRHLNAAGYANPRSSGSIASIARSRTT